NRRLLGIVLGTVEAQLDLVPPLLLETTQTDLELGVAHRHRHCGHPRPASAHLVGAALPDLGRAEEVSSWMPEHVSRVVPIAILTMLRRGELLSLRDSDIDFDHGAITILGQAQGDHRTRTKTSADRRTIDVGPAA